MKRVMMAGHGGQGIMKMGEYISYYAIFGEKHTAYIPSYGPETRGGKARCYVIVDEGEIDSPMQDEWDVLIIMNAPSMDYIDAYLKKGGTLIYNTSLVKSAPKRDDIRVVGVPATELAKEAGNVMAANSVMFGAYLKATGEDIDDERVAGVYRKLFGEKENVISMNKAAVEKGMKHVGSTA